MSAGVRRRVGAYLHTHHVATLATMAADGPWAAAVFYVNDGTALYFLSSPNSRHCRNLQQDARAAATIQADTGNWQEIKGVQMEGTVTLLAGPEEDRARRLYAEKFPLIGDLAQAPAAIVAALARVRWYCLAPTRVFFIDNAAGFGRRDEIALDIGGGR
jgi:uncharacterized protein YhbP (UPF0306 family)